MFVIDRPFPVNRDVSPIRNHILKRLYISITFFEVLMENKVLELI